MLKKQSLICLKLVVLIWLACQLTACAHSTNKQDPLEPLNRRIYGLNKVVNKIVIRPASRLYLALIPKFVRIPIGNFFQNLNEVPNVANDLLQGEFSLARHDSARFIINSLWGLGGLLDVAGMTGLERHHQDFGITMAKWGYRHSAYFVIPAFGPSTLRDSVGQAVTYFMGIPAYINNVKLRNSLLALYILDTYSGLLKLEPAMGEAVDEYVFLRDIYLQNRAYKIEGEKDKFINNNHAALEGPPD